MRIFKTKVFARWASKEKLSDKCLCQAVNEMEQGLIDANLGGHVYKKRIALEGRSKRSSVRTILIRSRTKHFSFLDMQKMKKRI